MNSIGTRETWNPDSDDDLQVDGASPRRKSRGRKTIVSVEDLVAMGIIDVSAQSNLEQVARRYSISIPSDLAEAISFESPNGPLHRQFVPGVAELEVDNHEVSDPIGDKVHARSKALIHRYPDRVLLKVTHTCPVYCRFCFRRDTVGHTAEPVNESDVQEALGYIRLHPEIREVIMTGGDPLTLSNRRLADIIQELNQIPSIEVIRIHTRFPIAQPNRITSRLAKLLRGRIAVYVVLHCNHANELTSHVLDACARLIDQGIPMLSQTVLLRDVNDDPDVMAELMRKLVASRIKPYYLHHLDLAHGTGHFRTTLSKGQAIMRHLRGRISGMCQPTYVLDIPGGHGKVPVMPAYLTPGLLEGEYIIEDYQGGNHPYFDVAAKMTD